MATSTPFFTVIIPTRNRPELFTLALESVLAQTFKDKEIIVINDGSEPELLVHYRELEAKYCDDRIKFRYQISRPWGHGQSYSMNTGALVGSGKYLAFLDDDDYWTDSEHLNKAYEEIIKAGDDVDAYYTNQRAFFSDGTLKEENVWIEDLRCKLKNSSLETCEVDASFLLSSNGFAHLNCTIIKRQLYLDMKGMDEGIRYDCDRDLYIRTLDKAKKMLFCPRFVSKHHIPDKSKKGNMSTVISSFEKYLYQISVYEKALLLCVKPEVKAHSRIALSNIFKHISDIYSSEKQYNLARVYAQKALALNPTLKWWCFTNYMAVKLLFDLLLKR
ncbi:glycosyltransferase family A protein [Alteromonas sp. MTD1]|uniref:glycosyltransferase n=1 Tax=Alteromonas sp. MTD1 TaxID=3057962 RepID=UPI0036F1B118